MATATANESTHLGFTVVGHGEVKDIHEVVRVLKPGFSEIRVKPKGSGTGSSRRYVAFTKASKYCLSSITKMKALCPAFAKEDSYGSQIYWLEWGNCYKSPVYTVFQRMYDDMRRTDDSDSDSERWDEKDVYTRRSDKEDEILIKLLNTDGRYMTEQLHLALKRYNSKQIDTISAEHAYQLVYLSLVLSISTIDELVKLYS